MAGIAVLFSAVGLLIIGLALPMIYRRVRPNAVYGLRVPATFADDWVWYEANARSGRDLLILGIVLITVALLLLWIRGIDEATYALVNAGILVAGALVCCVVGWRRANRMLEQRRRSS